MVLSALPYDKAGFRYLDEGKNIMFSIDFGLMPVSMACVESAPAADKRHRMVWKVNSDGLLAVSDPPPLDLVYQNQHADPAVSQIWRDHHQSFARFFTDSYDGSSVLEIGGGTGLLASVVQDSVDRQLEWLILEPFFPEPLPSINQVVWRKGWFPADSPAGEKPCIVATHVLEHTTNPREFIDACSAELALGGHLFLSWPDMEEMARRGDLNMLNFEHLHFLPLDVVENLLAEAGLRVKSIETFKGHSIFIDAVKTDNLLGRSLPGADDTKSLETLATSYQERLNSLVERMNQEVRHWSGEVSLFGAHIFSQYLIAAGLDTSRISRLLDNSKSKIGKRLYGTDLFVANPEALKSGAGHLILIAAALYESEILHQLKGLNLSSSRIVTSRSGNLNFP